MTRHKDVQLMLYEYLHDELAPTNRAEVEDHLSSCKECSLELETLRETVSLLPTITNLPSDERGEEFWREFSSTVVTKTAGQESARKNPLSGIVEWIEETILLQPRYVYVVGGTIAITLATLAILSLFLGPQRDLAEHIPSGKPLEHTSELIGNEQSRVPVERVNQYFHKSKTLLVGLANMKTDDNEPLDLRAEQRVSHDLIREARYLKQQPLDVRSRQLMNDLDRILIELANIDEQNDLPNVEIIRGGIHQENLLFKIRMAEAMYDSAQVIYANERR